MFAVGSRFIFAIDVFANVEISTNIVKLNTSNIGNSEYFTSNDYDDVELIFGIESTLFGAYTTIGIDEKQKKISMHDIYAWADLGGFLKITIGDFSSRVANILIDAIDEYNFGILRYGFPGSTYVGFDDDNTIEGDELNNFIIDLHSGSTTLSFAMNPYINKDMPELNIKKYNVHLGGRAYAAIGDFGHMAVTVVYNDIDKELSGSEIKRNRTTIGAFIGSSNFLNTFGLMAGYTASVLDDSVEHGIDIRAEVPLGAFVVATHNNLSLYGDKEMVLYNEVKCEALFKNDLVASLAMRSQYYNSNGATKDSVYDLGIYLGFDYAIADAAIISTGIDLTGIGNDTRDVIIGIPLKFEIAF